MSEEVKIGQKMLIYCLVFLFLLLTIPIIANIINNDLKNTLRDVLYLVASVILMTNVYKGSVWSWRILIFLCFLSGILLFMISLFFGDTFVKGLLLALVAIFFLVIGLFLVSDGYIRRYLEFVWSKRNIKIQKQKDL